MKRLVGVDDALARINADGVLQTEICAALESLADGLPDSLDADLTARLAPILNSSWSEHVSLQEDAIFPILKRCHAGSDALILQIEQLEIEHGMIADSNREITEQFDLALQGIEPSIDMLGYMLRGAFLDRRRHLDCERRVFATMLPATLAPVDREVLLRWLSSHAWPRALSNSAVG